MPRLAIVARQGQHFILNQDSLLSAAREAGYLADVLPLERMTVNEQIHALRTVRRVCLLGGQAPQVFFQTD
jgi:hypothetical protein